MEIATSAREEIGFRIETLRSQASHNREDALDAEEVARRYRAYAAKCDALAGGYAELLNRDV